MGCCRPYGSPYHQGYGPPPYQPSGCRPCGGAYPPPPRPCPPPCWRPRPCW